MRCELEAMEKQKQEREKAYKQKAHSIYKKIEKYNAKVEVKQENLPKEDDGIDDDEEEFEDEEVEDEEEFEDEEEVTDDGEDEKKPVASKQSMEDTHQRIVKTTEKGTWSCVQLCS